MTQLGARTPQIIRCYLGKPEPAIETNLNSADAILHDLPKTFGGKGKVLKRVLSKEQVERLERPFLKQPAVGYKQQSRQSKRDPATMQPTETSRSENGFIPATPDQCALPPIISRRPHDETKRLKQSRSVGQTDGYSK